MLTPKKQLIITPMAFFAIIGLCAQEPSAPELSGTLEQKTYQDLITIGIKPYIFKTRRRKQLEALGALLADTACKRIGEILGTKEGQAITGILQHQLPILLKPYGKMDYIKAAYRFASDEFIKQIMRDNDRLGGIGAIVRLPLERKYDLIAIELEELNERYTPIINAIVNELKRPTILPYKLSIDIIKAVRPPIIPVQ